MKKLFRYADQLVAAVWERVKNSTTLPPLEASVFRIFFGLFLLLFSMPNYAWIGDIPQSFFDPPILSLANLFTGFPPKAIFFFCNLIIPLLVLCITLGVKTRWSSIALFTIYVFVSSFGYSLGKIDHNILLWFALLCFAFSNWGTHLALAPDKPVKDHQSPITLVAVGLAFGMFSAGLEKARYWVDFDLETSGFLLWFYAGYFNIDRNLLLSDQVFQTPSLILEIGEYAAITFEITGFLFLLSGRIGWRCWLIVGSCFHLTNSLYLNIHFTEHAIVYLAFFICAIGKNLKPVDPDSSLLKRPYYLVVFFAAGLTLIHMIERIADQGSSCLFIQDLTAEWITKMYLAVALWPPVIIYQILNLRNPRIK
ncbi:MAG: hypothetical protein O7C75_14405 [Verrucomicrobia bacterium]|nr:hypothetical protein [Verrucomicrobiota bacterium]